MNGGSRTGGRGWRLIALLAVAVFLGLILRFWNPVYGFTAFLQLDSTNDDVKIAAFRELPVYVYRDTGGYDGLYYAQIAYHPLLNSPELPRAMDNFAYRARRILPPALAWILAAGQRAWIVQVYAVLNVIAWLFLALILWRLLAVGDLRAWLAWAGLLFSAGALASVRLALTDLVALTVLAAGMLALERRRPGWAIGFLAAAGLARETSLLALPGFWERRDERGHDAEFDLGGRGQIPRHDPFFNSPFLSGINVRRTLCAAAPFAAWLIYVRWRVGPAEQGWGNFTWPLAAFVEKWRACLVAVRTLSDPVLAWTTLLATAGVTAQALYILVRPRVEDAWWRLGAAYVVLSAFLGTAVWEDFPGAALRVLLPLNLAFNVLATRRRTSLAWLIAGNLTVFSGLLTLRDVPFDPRGLAAVRQDGVACVAREGTGWFGGEHTSRHTWAWSSGPAEVEFETWPHDNGLLRLNFSLRSLAPRTVVIRQGGREVGRIALGTSKVPATVDVAVTAGKAVVHFDTPTPGVPEGRGPDARVLAFALYDLTVTPVHDGPPSP